MFFTRQRLLLPWVAWNHVPPALASKSWDCKCDAITAHYLRISQCFLLVHVCEHLYAGEHAACMCVYVYMLCWFEWDNFCKSQVLEYFILSCWTFWGRFGRHLSGAAEFKVSNISLYFLLVFLLVSRDVVQLPASATMSATCYFYFYGL